MTGMRDCVPSFLQRLQLKLNLPFWQLQRMDSANTLSSKLAQLLASVEPAEFGWQVAVLVAVQCVGFP